MIFRSVSIRECHCEPVRKLVWQSVLCLPLPLGEVPPQGAERAVSFADSSPTGGAMWERIATVAARPRNDILKYDTAVNTRRAPNGRLYKTGVAIRIPQKTAAAAFSGGRC